MFLRAYPEKFGVAVANMMMKTPQPPPTTSSGPSSYVTTELELIDFLQTPLGDQWEDAEGLDNALHVSPGAFEQQHGP